MRMTAEHLEAQPRWTKTYLIDIIELYNIHKGRWRVGNELLSFWVEA